MKKVTLILASALLLSCFTACKKDDPTVTQTRSGWKIDAPAYMDGKLSFDVYKTNLGFDLDPEKQTDKMQIISGTSRKGFETYLDKVKKNDYTEIVRTEVNGNLFVEYEKDGKLLYTYYTAYANEARVVTDSASVVETDAEYDYTPKANESTTIYQWSMMNDPLAFNGTNSIYANNGMFYIIHQANNKIILVDGGGGKQATETAVNAFLDFLYEITEKDRTEKIEVSAFILTHAHGDHRVFVQRLLEKHSDKIYIERAFYNVPFHDSTSSKKSYIHFAEMLKTHNPNIIYLKPHTGQSIRLGELTLDIMLTHEDLVIPESATSRCGDFNNTTTVIKFSAFGKSYLQLGDYSGSHSDGIESIFLGLYKNGTAYPALQSDIVQVAHHAIEGDQANLYNAIGARYAFIPQTDTDFDAEGVVMMKSTFQATVEQLYESNANAEIYLQSRYTHALTIAQDGTITHSQEPIRGANADYADLLATVPPYQK